MNGCPVCGLFFGHVNGCRGVIAAFWSWGNRQEADGFGSVEEAARFLMGGEDAGTLASEAVLLPDGTVLLDKAALSDMYVHGPW